jgi:hypothetical protein
MMSVMSESSIECPYMVCDYVKKAAEWRGIPTSSHSPNQDSDTFGL